MSNDDDFDRALESLIDFQLARGCPCRFPRFRAVVGRSTHGVAGGSFTSDDQRKLIHVFERKVPLVDRRPLEGWGGPIARDMYEANCVKCGSHVSRSSSEFANGGWIDVLVITPASGVVDLGAKVEGGRVLRARPWISPGPAMAGIERASRVFPLTPEGEWLAWMRALAA